MTGSNPKWIATIGLVASAVMLAVAFRAGDLPLISPENSSYSAEFTDAGGLRAGDPVQVAGVVVGRVEKIDVASDKVLVEFEIDADLVLGDRTVAAVKVGSLLGQKYLEIAPLGEGRLEADTTIPLDRTTPAYDVVAAFEDLTDITAQLDEDQLATALDTLSDTFRNSGPQVRSALRGLSRFSTVIASRDRELEELVQHADATTEVLDERRGDIVRLIESTNLVLDELQLRKAAIHSLLVNTTTLAEELRGVVEDNQETLTPALRRLESVTRLLGGHQRDLRAIIRNSHNYIATFTNVVGSGPWIDMVIPRLPNTIRVDEE